MSIKKQLQKWLGIVEFVEFDERGVTERLRKEFERAIERRLAAMQPYNCIVCNKGLISGRDAVYSDYKAHKFCSHECIDKFKEPNKLTRKRG